MSLFEWALAHSRAHPHLAWSLQITSEDAATMQTDLERMCLLARVHDKVLLRPTDFVKVPFLQALDLVGRRRVLVRGGTAFVPRDRLISIITSRFRASVSACAALSLLPWPGALCPITRTNPPPPQLSRGLAFANKALPTILQDDRLGDILVNMTRSYIGREYGKGQGALAGAEVRAGDVQGLSESSYPLCMEHLHRGLMTHHHLRHDGRMQYGLFLKGLGLGLEEALIFWQTEFTKSMSPDDFVKRYGACGRLTQTRVSARLPTLCHPALPPRLQRSIQHPPQLRQGRQARRLHAVLVPTHHPGHGPRDWRVPWLPLPALGR